MSSPQENAIDVVMTVRVIDAQRNPVDISTATTKQILLIRPSGAILTKTASFTTDGTDGKLTYTTIAGDLTPSGTWHIQAYLVMTGYNGNTHAERFEVEA